MKGSELFRKSKGVIKLITIVVSVFPFFLRRFLWDVFAIYGGKLSVAFRYILLKTMVKSIGDNVYVGKYVVIKNHSNISIGSNVSIHDFTYIDGAGGLDIGNNVSIAHNCSILTTNHQWNDNTKPIKYNKEEHKKVIINNDVWLGCGVRILAGVEINKRSVVAAGAVVNKNVVSNTVIGGVPAKLIKKI